MPNGNSSTQPTNQKVPQQPGPPTDEPKPQKGQQAQKDGAKPFKFEFKPEQQAQQAQQAAPQANGSHAKPEAAVSGDSGEGWSDEHQQMLVKALKAIGKEVPDRYCRLAGCCRSCLVPLLPLCQCDLCNDKTAGACISGTHGFNRK